MIDTILLFGSTGMLGRYIYSYFKQNTNITVKTITSNEYRVSHENLDDLDDILVKKGINQNTCVINCIGCIPQRNTEQDANKYYIANAIFPHVLWNICKRYGAKLIHPTTDCVYSGLKGNYIETDPHDEKGHYGLSKSLGEPLGCTVIRCSIIGRELQNKKSFMEFVINSTGTIQGWDNHMWNGITCLQYCKVIHEMIKHDFFWSGVRHLYSPRSISKYEMASIIQTVFEVPCSIGRKTTDIPINKTLQSVFFDNDLFHIPDLCDQILELKYFNFI